MDADACGVVLVDGGPGWRVRREALRAVVFTSTIAERR
jgi:hypothetical protein